MNLGELIEYLESKDSTIVVKMGFSEPHSYRGDYANLAFEPCKNTTVGKMLECAKSALNKVYTGYKGGEFTMREYVDVYIAEYGYLGEQVGKILLDYMTESEVK